MAIQKKSLTGAATSKHKGADGISAKKPEAKREEPARSAAKKLAVAKVATAKLTTAKMALLRRLS
jgi:hypothetical protein